MKYLQNKRIKLRENEVVLQQKKIKINLLWINIFFFIFFISKN